MYINSYGQHFGHYTNITKEELINRLNRYFDRFFEVLNSDYNVLFIHTNEEFIYHKKSRDDKEELYNYLCKINDLLLLKYPNLKFKILNIDMFNKSIDYKNIINSSIDYNLPLSDNCETHTDEYYSVYRENCTVAIKGVLAK